MPPQQRETEPTVPYLRRRLQYRNLGEEQAHEKVEQRWNIARRWVEALFETVRAEGLDPEEVPSIVFPAVAYAVPAIFGYSVKLEDSELLGMSNIPTREFTSSEYEMSTRS